MAPLDLWRLLRLRESDGPADVFHVVSLLQGQRMALPRPSVAHDRTFPGREGLPDPPRQHPLPPLRRDPVDRVPYASEHDVGDGVVRVTRLRPGVKWKPWVGAAKFPAERIEQEKKPDSPKSIETG